MSELFNRQATVQMGTVFVDGLRVQFKVEKQDQVVPSHAEVTVWNLARETRAKMVGQTVPLVLSAGYEGGVEQLFNGDVMPLGVSVSRNGPDWLTTFKVGDGLLSYQTDRVQIPIAANTSITDALKQTLGALKNIDVKKTISDLVSGKVTVEGTFQQFTKGSAVSGRAIDEANRLANAIGYKLSVTDGQLEMRKFGAFAAEFVPDLSPETGLIGSPEVTKERFIKFRALLRPKIKPGRRVRVTSASHPTGLYIVARRVTHVGDTRGQEWYTDVEGQAL